MRRQNLDSLTTSCTVRRVPLCRRSLKWEGLAGETAVRTSSILIPQNMRPSSLENCQQELGMKGWKWVTIVVGQGNGGGRGRNLVVNRSSWSVELTNKIWLASQIGQAEARMVLTSALWHTSLAALAPCPLSTFYNLPDFRQVWEPQPGSLDKHIITPSTNASDAPVEPLAPCFGNGHQRGSS